MMVLPRKRRALVAAPGTPPSERGPPSQEVMRCEQPANLCSFHHIIGVNTGAACFFDFTIDQPTYQSGDLGFRCCANNAP